MFHSTPSYALYFGDKSDQLLLHDQTVYSALRYNPFALKNLAYIGNEMNLKRLVLLHQVHGILGYSVESNLLPPTNFEMNGDYIVTNTPGVGLAVLTADCVPIICYNSTVHAIGIAHAGWRGLVAGIIPRMLDHIESAYGASSRSSILFIGSFAHNCCYEVQKPFIDNFAKYQAPALQSIHIRGNRFFFDMKNYIIGQLRLYGIQDSQINQNYTDCTICSSSYYSYRMMREHAGRNITIAALRPSY